MSYTAGKYIAGGGVYVMGTSCSVENCTIVSNSIKLAASGTALGGGVYVTGTNAKIRNNIICGNSVGGTAHDLDVAASAVGLVFANNLLVNGDELPEGETNCLSGVDPIFAEDGGGYRLQDNSPCIDAGLRLDWCLKRGMAVDFDGNERCVRKPDIGCWESPKRHGAMIIFR